MLSQDLKQLSDTFDGWATGQSLPTPESWASFRRTLRHSIAKAALLELGVDHTVFDIDTPAPERGNVVPFPRGAS